MPQPIVYEYGYSNNLPALIGGSAFLVLVLVFLVFSMINKAKLRKTGEEFRPYTYSGIGVLAGWAILITAAIATGASQSAASEAAGTTQTREWLDSEYGITVDDDTAYWLWRAREDEDRKDSSLSAGIFREVQRDGETIRVRIVLAAPEVEDDNSYTLAVQEILLVE